MSRIGPFQRRRWIDTVVLAQFERRINAVDVAIAQRCARLHVPDPRADRDALIAATAAVHGMTLVTRNVQDFERLGVPIFNPWTVRPCPGVAHAFDIALYKFGASAR